MLKTKPLPSAELLRATFRYEERTGRLYWRAQSEIGRRGFAGKRAGGIASGFWRVSVKGYGLLLAHRVIWKMTYGVDPLEIDHKDGDPLNNRLANLREATRAQNMWNRRRGRRTGYRGVSRQGSRWRARIRVDGRPIHLGSFGDPDRAYAAYMRAAKAHFGEFARVD